MEVIRSFELLICGVTSQKSTVCICTAMKTLNIVTQFTDWASIYVIEGFAFWELFLTGRCFG
jgi:hypothetical protein